MCDNCGCGMSSQNMMDFGVTNAMSGVTNESDALSASAATMEIQSAPKQNIGA